jgi:hypothetical protein
VSLRWPVAPMVARSAAELPAGDHWSYETKFDGFRCIALRHDSVQLQSRQLRPLTLAFPDVVEAVSALPPGTVVDGELVVMVDGGWTSPRCSDERQATGSRPRRCWPCSTCWLIGARTYDRCHTRNVATA